MPTGSRGPEQLAREGSIAHLRDERRLAAPRHAGHGREGPERDGHVDLLEVVLPRALDEQRLPAALAALRGDRHRAVAAEVGAGDRSRFGEDRLEPPVGNDLATVLPRPGPDVDHPVGSPDRLLVVLDDQHRIPEIAESREGRDELCVVPLVKTDRRLVEDVQDAHQRRPDLGREPDALCLAAGQGLARPVDGQVVEPDVDQEAQSSPDLLEQLVRDRSLPIGDPARERLRPLQRVGDREIGHLRMSRPSTVTPSASGRSRCPCRSDRVARPCLLELGLDVLRVRLAVAPLEVRDDALERARYEFRRARACSGRRPSRPSGRRAGSRRPPAAGRGAAPGVPAVRVEDRFRDLLAPARVGGHAGPRDGGAGQTLFDLSGARAPGRSPGASQPGAGRAGAVRRGEGKLRGSR